MSDEIPTVSTDDLRTKRVAVSHGDVTVEDIDDVTVPNGTQTWPDPEPGHVEQTVHDMLMAEMPAAMRYALTRMPSTATACRHNDAMRACYEGAFAVGYQSAVVAILEGVAAHGLQYFETDRGAE